MPVALVMVRAIREYFQKTGFKVNHEAVIVCARRPDFCCLMRQVGEAFRNNFTVFRDCYQIGFKPAGGIRTAKDSCTWLALMKEELGTEWMMPDLFRLGASSLLGDIERQLFHFVTGRYAAAHELPMA